MRKLTCFLALLLFFSCKDKDDKNPKDKTIVDRPLITMYGIDSLKLGASKAELEKILNTRLTFKHIGVDEGYYDTIRTSYKGRNLVLYLDKADSISVVRLIGMRTEDSLCQTASGVGVGSEKIKVIQAFPDHTKFVGPEYEEYPVRSKTKYVVAVMDTIESRAIQFHLVNRKVVSVEISSHYEFY